MLLVLHFRKSTQRLLVGLPGVAPVAVPALTGPAVLSSKQTLLFLRRLLGTGSERFSPSASSVDEALHPGLAIPELYVTRIIRLGVVDNILGRVSLHVVEPQVLSIILRIADLVGWCGWCGEVVAFAHRAWLFNTRVEQSCRTTVSKNKAE